MPSRLSDSSSQVSKRSKMYRPVYSKKVRAKPVKVSFGRQPLPNLLRSTVKYSEVVDISLGISGYGNYTFSANGLFDPNITGTGHQPMYFDQMMNLYDHYTVLSSTIKFTPFYSGAFATIWTALKDDDPSLSVSAYYTAAERPGSMTTTESLSQQPGKPLWLKFDAGKTFGGDPIAQDSLQGTVSTNPSEQTYYNIFCNGGAAGVSNSVSVLVEIWYNVQFDELTSVVSS